MRSTSFHDNWFVRHVEETGLGTPVTLPHDAMLSEPRTAIAEGGLNVSWFEGRDYVYTKTFAVSAEQLEQHNVLEFEGVYRKAEVFINGQRAAFRPYGYTNFYVELDAFLRAGENTIEVIARNADQPNSRWYSGAGIYRPVKLWTSPKAHIELNGVRIRTVSIDPAVVEVKVSTSVPGVVKVQILDEKKEIACVSGEGTMNITIPDARLWSVENPNLYTARVTFGEDVAEETFGIRTLTWGKDGMKMNGQRVILRGACIHHDNGLLGAVCHPDAVERKLRILKENGYNAIRSAHNPCSKAALEVCDRIGLLVMDEYIDHWYIHKTMHDYVEFFDTFWKQDMTDMVEKDYNHPSVILYSTGNEVAETAQPKGIALAKEMTDFLHTMDNTRPVTCGINIFFNFLNSMKNDCLFHFHVPYENGTLEAVSYDASGREIGRNALTTAGEETMLRAVSEKETVEKGHLCYIRLQYTDKNGTVKPTERGILDVTVEGGKLVGLGSACPYYELSYLDTKADTYYGEAMAIVEAGEAGTVILTATDGKQTVKTAVTVLK